MFFAEKIFRNARVATMNPEMPWAQAVAVTNGMIVGVGDNKEMDCLKGPSTTVMDLEGRFMMPGFNDCHCHLLQQGLAFLQVDLTPDAAPDLPALKRRIAEQAAKVGPGHWILGWGYNETLMKERRQPTKEDLSEAAPNNPVFITRACIHMSTANKMALEIAGITEDTSDPYGGLIDRDSRGAITGLLKESAQNLVKRHIPRPGKKEIVAALALGGRAFVSKGITSITDAGLLIDVDGELEGWFEAALKGVLPLRCTTSLGEGVAARVYEMGLLSGYGNSMHRFGPLKLFMDGNIGAKTAAVTSPFLQPPYGCGVTYMEEEDLRAKVKKYHAAGYQIMIHAIGDRAGDMVLDAYEAALKDAPRPNHRHRIEHITLGARNIPRIKSLGVCLTLQPAFIYYFGADFTANVGVERAAKTMATRTAQDSGVLWGISTDCPCIDMHPKYTLYGALTRRVGPTGEILGPEEIISMEDALAAYTRSGAYLTFEERSKGVVKPGMLADFVVLSVNLLELRDLEQLLDMEILHTIVGGTVVHSK
ncbi:MAG: amidohydrolase [Desulfovibrio sp.]|jgi:predicted amidohydrolase YtcJ|nr:amidohydrolase [Desulfovibrio sp.]